MIYCAIYGENCASDVFFEDSNAAACYTLDFNTQTFDHSTNTNNEQLTK